VTSVQRRSQALPGHVWYVAYGSNLSSARFQRYIDGCRDSSSPTDWRLVEVPFQLVFARHDPWWEDGGVAFLDVDGTPPAGRATVGRAWRITGEQFLDVMAQECELASGTFEEIPVDVGAVVLNPDAWYGEAIVLSSGADGPELTFTSANLAEHERVPPAPRYRATIIAGLQETCGMDQGEANAYIDERVAAKER
jgi:hypothetical protein